MCEDFPACGHDICPDFDENGKQLNMKCTCGATLPITNRFSICDSCLSRGDEAFPDISDFDPDYEQFR